jgi:activating signal cointegrator complex subunit 1
MSLLTPERVESALKLLQGLDLKALLSKCDSEKKSTNVSEAQPETRKETQSNEETLPLEITLKGLVPMQNAAKTSVLYMPPVDDELRLYRFCQGLKEAFVKEGLIVEEDRPLLLHATIINTIYVKSPPPSASSRSNGNVRGAGRGGRGSKGKKERLVIDARDLIEEFEDFEWMSNVRVERVAVCRMGAKKVESELGNEIEELGEEYEVEGFADIA